MIELPSNQLAEKAAIGCILLGGQNTALDAFIKLTDDCFYCEPWKSAWRLLKEMSEDGRPIDGLTFLNEWASRKKSTDNLQVILSAQDDIPIASAMNEAPTASNLDYWVSELIELSERRSAIIAAAGLNEDIQSGDLSTTEAIARMEDFALKSNLNQSDILDSRAFIQRGMDDVERRFEQNKGGFSTAMKTGLTDLDRITGGFEPGESVIVGARPSVGKTAFAVTIANNMQEPVVFVSCEMAPAAIYRRYLSVHARVRAADIKSGRLSENDFRAMQSSNSALLARRFAFVDGTGGLTIGELKSKVVASIRRHGSRIVIVDYLQKVRPNQKVEKRTYEVGEISEGLQALARKQNVLVISLAQVSRDVAKQGRAPKIADLSDSSQIEKDADFIILLHRAMDANGNMDRETLVCVAKARDGETDICKLYFNAECTRFESIAN